METSVIILLSINGVTQAGILILVGLVVYYRKHKVMLVSSPPVLLLCLGAGLLLLLEVPIVLAVPNASIPAQWMHELGFVLLYGPLLLRTWRISQICRSKPVLGRLGTSPTVYRMVALLSLCICHLISLTLLQHFMPPHSISSIIVVQVLPIVGKVMLLCWGGRLCYMTRRAPSLYNDTTCISYSLWNHGTWIVVCSTIRLLSPELFTAPLYATSIQATTTTTILLLLGPKVYAIASTSWSQRSYEQKHHGHQLLQEDSSLHCQPCAYSSLDTYDEDYHQQREPDEKHYTKAEVDALIDMVSALKEERDKYKLKYRQLSASTTPVTPVLTSPLSHMILSGRISAGAWTLNPKTSEGYRYGMGGASHGTTPAKCACVSGSSVLNPANSISSSIAHGVLSPAGSTVAKSVLSSRASTASTCVTSSRGTTPGELHSDLLWSSLMTSPQGSRQQQQQLQQQLQQQASRRPSSLHWESRQYPGTAPYTARNMNVLVYI